MAKLEGVKVLDMKDGEVTKIEYEGEVYTKIDGVERKPKPGDKIRIINAHKITGGRYKNGDILTVKEYQPRGDAIVEHVEVEEHDIAIYLSEFEFVDESELKPTVNVGDLVKVSGNNAKHEHRDVAGWGKHSQGLVNYGEIGRVTVVESEGIYVKFVGKVITTGGYEVEGEFYLEHGEYEPLTFYDKPAQVGDKILINEHAWGTGGKYGKGDVLTVKEVREDNVVNVEENDRPISPIEFDIIERSGENEFEETTKFKAGDFAKVVGDTHFGGIKKGTVVEICAEADYDDDIRFETLNGDDYDFAKAESLEKVNPTERELTFFRAGRNIDEFKEGDVVEVLEDRALGSENKAGDIGVIKKTYESISDVYDVFVKARGIHYSHVADTLKLVAPVESRVDLSGEKSYA